MAVLLSGLLACTPRPLSEFGFETRGDAPPLDRLALDSGPAIVPDAVPTQDISNIEENASLDEHVLDVCEIHAADMPDMALPETETSVDADLAGISDGGSAELPSVQDSSEICSAMCEWAECGDDGCGGSCGSCVGPNQVCLGGQCVCVPDCQGAECGHDGYGCPCGECLETELCYDGKCVCLPQCETAECGDDGCGGVCGVCDDADLCTDDYCATVGVCVYISKPDETGCTLAAGCQGSCVNGKCEPFAQEVCDGKDNDCDGATDENLGETQCGAGVCAQTVFNCLDGEPAECDPMAGAGPETCDGADNDCDGETDEELGLTNCGLGACSKVVAACHQGELVDCDPLAGAAPENCDGADNDCDGKTDEDLGDTSCGFGTCAKVVANCMDGDWVQCDPHEGAEPEVCDGADNDCDGKTDEGLGETSCGFGACAKVVSDCIDGDWVQCDHLEGAEPEVCDGIDNDCDGETDEQLGETSCGLGACAHLVANCQNGNDVVCNPNEGSAAETCDGADNDCNGETDENLGQITCGVGVCEHVVAFCQNGQQTQCDPLAGAAPEECDGLDNDCDGKSDEELGETWCGQGQCLHLVANCQGGEPAGCNPLEGATPESCDGEDNDCDGETDEEQGETWCGQGQCLHMVANCQDGELELCDPLEGAQPEVCDGLDNDCDGETDGDALCDDGNPCTLEECLGPSGCSVLPLDGVACSDGNACTTGDHCTEGQCAGAAADCVDDNQCTVDSCDPVAGCINSPAEGLACGDESACHLGQCAPLASLAVIMRSGLGHTCALKGDGSVVCWGRNQYGQLGNGTFVDSCEPVLAIEPGGAVAVTAGREHSCAVTGAGSVYCWGENYHGQLGDGTKEHKATAVEVLDICKVRLLYN